jgi:hypothetical protein
MIIPAEQRPNGFPRFLQFARVAMRVQETMRIANDALIWK